jgi:XTP/dITP diphosphohydrolase
MKILLATSNKHKVSEIKKLISNDDAEILTLRELNLDIEVTEDSNTLEGNSGKKAMEIFNAAKIPTIADDTGLFVTALNGEPGVFSSRYAGNNASYEDNCNKLISELKNVKSEDRTAFFRSVICYYVSEKEYYFFEGICKGRIEESGKGKNGFGYDPLFKPFDSDKTFAEMGQEEKNLISHRGKAMRSFKEYFGKRLKSNSTQIITHKQ